jgi:hypothetical protein
MNIPMLKFITVISAGLLLSGCCSNEPKAGTSLETGLYQVGRGLASMKLGELEVSTNTVFEGQKDFAVGLFATDFSYVFNVTSSKGDSNNLYIEADAAVPQSPVSGKVGDSFTTTSSSGRANQIIINFASPFFTTTTTTTTNKTGTGTNAVTTVQTKVERTITDPKTLGLFFDTVKKAGISPSAVMTQ